MLSKSIRGGVLANGKIVICDFRKLNPTDFEPLYYLNEGQIRKETSLCAPDGRLFVNKKMPGCDAMAEMFAILIREKRETLIEYQEEYQKKFPNIKNFDDFEKMKGADDEKFQVLAMLAVPAELKRREIEADYNGKMISFQKNK